MENRREITILNVPLLLLSAGNSSRMGSPKGLLPCSHRDGVRTWLQIQLERFAQVGQTATIVLGAKAEEFFEKATFLCEGRLGSLHLQSTINPNPGRGQFSSIQCGLRILGASRQLENGCFLLPIDVPAAGATVWNELWNAVKNGKNATQAVVPNYRGQNGHPVWLSAGFCQRLLTLPPSARLDEQIRKLSATEVKHVEIQDRSIVLNLNTPEDFKTFEKTLWPSEENIKS